MQHYIRPLNAPAKPVLVILNGMARICPCHLRQREDSSDVRRRKTTDLDAALAELTPERIERNQRIYADMVTKYYSDPDFRAAMDAIRPGC